MYAAGAPVKPTSLIRVSFLYNSSVIEIVLAYAVEILKSISRLSGVHKSLVGLSVSFLRVLSIG